MRSIKIFSGLLVAALIVLGLTRISFDVDILKLLPANLKQVQGLALFLKNFSAPNELIVTVEASDSATAEAAATSLAKELRKHPEDVCRVVERPPWEANSADLASLTAYLILNQSPETVAVLGDKLSPAKAAQTLQAARDSLSTSFSPAEVAARGYDPYSLTDSLHDLMPQKMRSEFASADGKFRVLYVDAAPDLKNYKDAIAWLKKIHEVVAHWKHDSPVILGFTGEPAFVADISGTMQWDMMSASFVTLGVIALIFWSCYRRFKPLFFLLLMLMLIFVITLGLSGLFLSQLTAMGVGFASIMIGLSVDYGYLVYQKSLGYEGSLIGLQLSCLQNIMWTAGTTAAAFFALNLSSLPGLSQLGNLVGIGVLVGATVMLLVFAPITMRWRNRRPRSSVIQRLFASASFHRVGAILTLAAVCSLLATLALRGLPAFDSSPNALRPRHAEAYTAMDRLSAKLSDQSNLLSLIVTGTNEQQVADRLHAVEDRLQSAQTHRDLTAFTSPLPLWPAPDHQKKNLPTLATLATSSLWLKQTLLEAGFTDEAFTFDGATLGQWGTWAKLIPPIWPQGESADWILRRVASRANGQLVALGLVTPVAGHEKALIDAIQGDGVYLVSWNELGRELREVVPHEFISLILSLLVIVAVILLLGLRSFLDVGLLLLNAGLVFLSLAGAMRWLGLEWNLFNLAAVLLLLGTGIDYSILLLLALRRNGGDLPEARRSIGLVVGLCAASAAAGFGTIGWANHRGLASLGLTCSLGLVLDILISLFLLPLLWQWSHRCFSVAPPRPAG